MASTWGDSWGDSWGDTWDRVVVEQAQSAGGGRKRKKRDLRKLYRPLTEQDFAKPEAPVVVEAAPVAPRVDLPPALAPAIYGSVDLDIAAQVAALKQSALDAAALAARREQADEDEAIALLMLAL